MSASTEKKLRQAAREAGTDKKVLAAQAEAEKKAKSKRQWTIGTIAIVLLIAFILLLNSPLLFTATTALSVGDEDYSPAEMNYYYASQYAAIVNQYGSYAAVLGLDTSAGIAGLDSQPCPMYDGSWKDYFLDTAKNQLSQITALCDYAEENGIELNEEELAAIDAGFEGMDEYAVSLGYRDMDAFFAANYGTGVDAELIRQCSIDSTVATKVITQYMESLDYSAAELEDYYQSLNGEEDYFDYAYYYVAGKTEENAEGVSTEISPEALAEAKATAEEILAKFEAETGDDVTANLTAAVSAVVADAEATHSSMVPGAGLSGYYKEWMMAERKTGDAAVFEDGASGSYVVAFIGRNDNHYPLAQVRHILVKAEPAEDGSYTAKAKATAQMKAQDILRQFEEGDKTEESFAALAEQYSEDAGSNTNGGLYDQVVKGQMVEEFDKFCFEGHQKGDTAIVYGESTSYAGYHVMYYVGEGQQYSDLIAESYMTNDAANAFVEELSAGYEPKEGFAFRFVGK